jgi:hypothetical protein
MSLNSNHVVLNTMPNVIVDVSLPIVNDCKLDLVTIQGNLTGDQYIRDILQPVVIPHFDNHPLATRPVYMDENATNGSCGMSVNSNDVVLNTMPNVFVDVGLPTVDV